MVCFGISKKHTIKAFKYDFVFIMVMKYQLFGIAIYTALCHWNFITLVGLYHIIYYGVYLDPKGALTYCFYRIMVQI
jgi:hypothetical protein